MTHPICVGCGSQYGDDAGREPDFCPVCTDERQYVAWEGQRWTTLQSLERTHRVLLAEDGGLLGVGIDPPFAINQRALLIPDQHGNVLWECTSLVTREAIDSIAAVGGISAIAISHPHFYSSMVEWSTALGGVPIYLHELDRGWNTRRSAHVRYWRGTELPLSPSIKLLHVGGHFPGSSVIHWQGPLCPEGALLTGDSLQVTFDRTHVSFMRSYPNLIPLEPRRVHYIRAQLESLSFDNVYGYTWGRNIIGGGRLALDRSFDRYLHATAT